MAQNKSSRKPDEITIKELVSNLKIGQLWTVVGAFILLLFGSFQLGYKINQSSSERKLEQLESQAEKNKLLVDKERFLSLYLRFELAKNKYEEDGGSQQNAAEYSKTEEAFNTYLSERIDREKLELHKGEGNLATIEFSDGTSWTIPRKLHVVYKH